MKRVTDIAVSAGALFLLWPALLMIALAVRLTSPGPVLAARTVLGEGGRPFRLFEFRTWNDHGEHPTAFGQYLYDTGLNALPQLWNVLRGELTLVGPIPESAVVSRLLDGAHPAGLPVRHVARQTRRFRVPRSPLSVFRFFVGAQTREVVEDCLTDIRRDAREMNRENLNLWLIRGMVSWKSIGCIASVTWEGCINIFERVLLGLRALRLLIGGPR